MEYDVFKSQSWQKGILVFQPLQLESTSPQRKQQNGTKIPETLFIEQDLSTERTLPTTFGAYVVCSTEDS
jgi:hypothetical protein